jgi:hypothetical protein
MVGMSRSFGINPFYANDFTKIDKHSVWIFLCDFFLALEMTKNKKEDILNEYPLFYKL